MTTPYQVPRLISAVAPKVPRGAAVTGHVKPRYTKSILALSVLSMGLLMPGPARIVELRAAELRFHPGWEVEWTSHQADDFCRMSMSIGEYGEARFIATAVERAEFEFQARKDMQRSGPIDVYSTAPQWHPKAPARARLGALVHIDGGGGMARGDLASNMMLALRDGMHIELVAESASDPRARIVVELVAKEAQAAIDEFLTCAHTQVMVAWQAISRTRLTYEVGGHSIDQASQQRLSAVALFAQQDQSVTTIYIDGHTDATGNERSNYELSKRRAEAVAEYLRGLGLGDRKLVVRYHGALYPVADNDTAAGKAANRRTTIRLERAAVAAAGR